MIEITRRGEAAVPTRWGAFQVAAFEEPDGTEHLAFVLGEVAAASADAAGRGTLVRLHSECLTGDVFGSARCDCGPQLAAAMEMIRTEGTGVLVYLRGHEGRGIGIAHKIAAYALQDQGLDTLDANEALGLPVDARSYDVGAAILADLGVQRIRVMTNNPDKWIGMQRVGLTVTERVQLPVTVTDHNRAYLTTKRDRLGHLIDLD